MPKRKKAPELTFQQHIADYLVREHEYGVLEQAEITDTEHFIAEDQLWAFLRATQADTLDKLEEDYSTDAREEVFKAPPSITGMGRPLSGGLDAQSQGQDRLCRLIPRAV